MFEALKPGTVLWNRYEIIQQVGQGGMGAVYKAEDTRLEGRLCAVKEVIPEPGAYPERLEQTQEQFRREASVLARLDHPNLPKVSDFFLERERQYLVMDFVPGRDLHELLIEARSRGEFLEEETVVQWAMQMCNSLDYMHSQPTPVLHRDIKPSNIKLTPSGTIKLVDFGLVKLMAPDDKSTITVLQGRGTLHYIPLEQYGGDTGHTDVRSDIYSLGATLYHLLTGQAPVEAKARFLDPSTLMPPRDVNPRLSQRTQEAILHAMEVHPQDRPNSITQFQAELSGNSYAHLQAINGEPLGYQYVWLSALNHNRFAIIMAFIALAFAVVVTILSPTRTTIMPPTIP